MKAILRVAAGLALVLVAFGTSGCSLIPGFGGQATPAASVPTTGTASTTASGSASASAAPSPATTTTPVSAFAEEPAPKPADPILTPGDWGYHSGVDYDDSGSRKQINRTLEAKERYQLVKEQYYSLLKALKKSSGVKELVDKAGGDTDDIKYSVIAIDAEDLVSVSTPWVTATLRASFPTEDGLKAVDVYVYRLKTSKGLNNTPYVSGTAVGYVDVDGSIRNPTNPAFPD